MSERLLQLNRFYPIVLIILSLASLWSIPGTIGAPTLGNLVPKNFEVNAMAVSQHGDVAAASFYGLDPTVIPWNLTNPIYKYVGVTLIVSNLNSSAIANTLGINIPTQIPTLLPFKAFLIIQGVQTNAPKIASDIESVFGLPSGSFVALASNPLTLPVSVFAADFPKSQYSGFVNKFVSGTSNKALVIGQYSASLLETSSSGLLFNSVESLTYPTSPLISAGALNAGMLSTVFTTAFSINSTGVVVLEKNKLDFSLARDHTLDFASILGLTTTTFKSTTNETFATVLPGGTQVKSFNPSTMIIQSSNAITLVLGLFPWVGSAQRTLPDISVTFHYPAFDSPILTPSWTVTPSTFNVDQNYTLSLTLTNTGAMNAQIIQVNLGYAGALSWGEQAISGNAMGTIQYKIPSIPVGSSNTTNLGKFLAFLPENAFNLGLTYLDAQNFAYTWNTVFTVAADVKTNGPLIVTKSVLPTTPAFGQNGTVTVTIHNTDTVTPYYASMLDLTPEAIPFLYPNGPYPNNNQYNGYCPNLYSPYANLTWFTFTFYNNCGSTIVTQVSIVNNSIVYPVATPNIPLSQGASWSPLYRYPSGFSPRLNSPITVQLTLQNSQQVSTFGYVSYTGPIPQLGDPHASYLSLNCSLSPCNVFKGGSAPTLSGILVNGTGTPITGATIQIGYYTYSSFYSSNTRTILGTVTTSTKAGSLGTYSLPWSTAPQLPPGSYQLFANYTGVAGVHSPQLEYLQAYVVEPISIGPGQTITMSYPYFFNTTGPLTIEPERITYSSKFNQTYSCGPSCTGTAPILGEYEAQSSTVTVNVQPPPILPVVETTMSAQRLGPFYIAQNQSFVKITLTVTNNGTQTATNLVVNSTIPRGNYNYYLYGPQLPISDKGNVTVDASQHTVTFNVASLAPGQAASAWYIVQANSTGYTTLYQTASNVTAQAGATNFKFGYTGALLGIYYPPTYTQPPAQGYLQAYTTIDPPLIANGTSTIMTLHLYNAGSFTYTSINATIQSSYYGQVTLAPLWKTVPVMAPGTSQTVTFTATANAQINFYGNSTNTSIYGTVYYNQSSTQRYSAFFNSNLLIYNGKAGFNPSLKIDVAAVTGQVSAGAPDIIVVTATNDGSTAVSNFNFDVTSNSPQGNSSPEISYGSSSNNWPNTILAGQTVNFRVGIQTRPGGQYNVFVNYASYSFNPKGNSACYSLCQYATITGSTAATIAATDTAGPAVTIPWLSPFAPTSSDPERIWTQVSDGSGINSVSLEYSTDKSIWTSIPMTPLIGSYLTGQNSLQIQSTIGDVYNATIPAQNGGTTIFYRIRATDRIGNPTLQDNNGIDFSYTVQGSNSAVIQVPTGTNVVVNVTQTNPNIGIKTTITLNVSTPISIQVTKLSTNPGGTPPSGTSALGIYLQINANVSITLQARIRVYYTAAQIQGLNVTTLAPYYWDGTNWVSLSNVVVNTSEMWVEGTVTHFSLFALFASSAQQPPTPNPTPSSQPPWLIIGVVIAVVAVAAVGGFFYRTKMRKPGNTLVADTPSPAPPPAPAAGNPAS